MRGTCVMKSNAKCFENESQRRNEKGTPISAGTSQTLTQMGSGALKVAAASLFWHGRLYVCQRSIYSRGNGVSFLVPSLRYIFEAFCIRFHYTCSLHVPFMLLNHLGFLGKLSINMACSNKWRIAIYIYIYICIYI